MSRSKLWCLWLLAMPVLAGAQAVDPVYSGFERSYKTALWQTSQQHGPEAAGALTETRAAWQPLVGGLLAGGESEHRLAVEVSGRLALAEVLVGKGQLSAAHEMLEPVRAALGEYRAARHEWRINDKLTGFHAAMEAVLLAPDGKPWPAASPEAIAAWRAMLPELRSRWAAATALIVGDADSARLDALAKPVSVALERIGEALRGEDGSAMLAAVRSLKPAFASVFLGVDPAR